MERGFVHPHPGSARRFLQPLGGFLADSSLRPCFVPLPSLGYLSLQSLALQRSRTRLRAACSLAVIPAQPARAHAALSPRVSPDADLVSEVLAGLPPRLWVSFRRADHGGLASRSPWTARSGLAPDHADHPLRSLIPPAKLALPTPQVSLQEQPCSPGCSAPPEPSPPVPWTL